MPSFRIVSVSRANNQSSCEAITQIGYYQTAYKPKVIIPVEEAIKRIENNPQEFYVRIADNTVFVKIEKAEGKNPFIKTLPDNTYEDHLLSLG